MAVVDQGRRRLLGGLLATGLIPAPSWADAGAPAFLSAAATRDGTFLLCGITANFDIAFQLPLPARGHAAAAHPTRPEAVAFARRPGTFAIVIDCLTGAVKAQLTAPLGRHFYGHGVFSADGELLFTTENDFENGLGRIGVWAVHQGYRWVDEWSSGGVGPHDIKRIPNSDILVVANGGIDTHPDTGRTKLNIPTMHPNLSYIDAGDTVETASLPQDAHKNSIRHLAVSESGQVSVGMQWQGDGAGPALVGTHRRGEPIELLSGASEQSGNLDGYIGSIACSVDGSEIAVTSPRGGEVQIYDAATQHLVRAAKIEDVCGVSVLGNDFAVTAGTGALRFLSGNTQPNAIDTTLMWDNHLIAI